MGLGTQMLAWHEDFCEQLAARGYFVIRHDNRDIGRSSRLDGAPVPTLKQLALRDKRAAAYTLSDMANDSVGVLDHLGIEQAHIVGASMGGMIAQRVAIEHPERTLSLTSIMSNTGSFWSGQPALTMYAFLLRPAPKERNAYIDRAVDSFVKIGGKGFEPDVEDLRDIATRSYDRGHDPRGSARQLGAIVADRDRGPELRKLRVPDDGHPRRRRPARAALGRARHGQGHPRLDLRGDQRHGPRPAARRLAADHRRDRAERRAGYPSNRISTTTSSNSRMTPPVIAPPCHCFAQWPGSA